MSRPNNISFIPVILGSVLVMINVSIVVLIWILWKTAFRWSIITSTLSRGKYVGEKGYHKKLFFRDTWWHLRCSSTCYSVLESTCTAEVRHLLKCSASLLVLPSINSLVNSSVSQTSLIGFSTCWIWYLLPDVWLTVSAFHATRMSSISQSLCAEFKRRLSGCLILLRSTECWWLDKTKGQ